jgi:Zn-dependent membrane protease YugP
VDLNTSIVIAGAVFAIALGVRLKMKSTYAQWSQVKSATGMVGGQVARRILDANGLMEVPVEPVRGTLTDRYDPQRDAVRLSKMAFVGTSVASIAVAAHECGHALQNDSEYGPLRARTALLPFADAGGRYGLPLVLVGIVFSSPVLVQVGALGYAASMLVHLATLPVEFDASRRARGQFDRLGLVSADSAGGAREVLRAAAMAPIAGVASSAWYLVELIVTSVRKLLGKREEPLPKAM